MDGLETDGDTYGDPLQRTTATLEAGTNTTPCSIKSRINELSMTSGLMKAKWAVIGFQDADLPATPIVKVGVLEELQSLGFA